MNGAAVLTDDEDLPDVPAVEFGGTDQARINYLSVSQLKTAAPWVEGGCLRKWYLKKVKGLEEPQRGSQELGKQVHAELEHYMLTGEDVLGPIARAALPYLPPPKLMLGCEVSITESNKPITGAKLLTDGIPLVGFVDRVDDKLAPGTEGPFVSVVDYKTSSNPEKWAASPEDLSTTETAAGIQMVGYAVALSNDLGQLREPQGVFLEHLYLHTKPTKADIAAKRDAKQVVGSITPAKARAEWAKRIDPLAARLRQVAKAKTLDEVEPSWESCGAYGGCHFHGTCLMNEAKAKPKPEVKHMSLKELLASRRNSSAPLQPSIAVEPQIAPNVTVVTTGVAADAAEPTPVIVPPDAPKSDPAKAAEAPPEAKPPETEKPKRGRKPKDTAQNPADATAAGSAAASGNPVQSATVATGAQSPAGAEVSESCADCGSESHFVHSVSANGPVKLELFVDCIGKNPGSPLGPYVEATLATFKKAFPDLLDIRCAPKKNAEGKDHPLAFGGWRGVLSAEVKMNPPAPGRYFALGVAQSEILQVVTEALEPLCAEFTKGVR
jgi:hypothetical protein